MGLVDADFTKEQAALCFVWSKPFVSDEVRRRRKLVEASFVDFLEALCRVLTFKARFFLKSLRCSPHLGSKRRRDGANRVAEISVDLPTLPPDG